MIVHLTNAMSDDTVVEVHYSPKLTACRDEDFAPIRRGGLGIELSPKNTPIVLELQGTYRFENLSTDTEARIIPEYIKGSITGDIMSKDVYTKASVK